MGAAAQLNEMLMMLVACTSFVQHCHCNERAQKHSCLTNGAQHISFLVLHAPGKWTQGRHHMQMGTKKLLILAQANCTGLHRQPVLKPQAGYARHLQDRPSLNHCLKATATQRCGDPSDRQTLCGLPSMKLRLLHRMASTGAHLPKKKGCKHLG